MHFSKEKTLFLCLILVCVLVFSLSSKALAAGGESPKLINPLQGKSITTIVSGLLKKIFGLTGVIALVMFIYGGILWMTSGGSVDKVKKGKDTILWAILGLAFIFFAYSFLSFILDTFVKAG